MARQTNPNNPCPCGSGKTFEQCCGCLPSAKTSPPTGHQKALERAIDWLMTKHRKALMDALANEILGPLSDEDAQTLRALDNQTLQEIQANILEGLIAEGQILVRGKPKRVAACLLGPNGPLFTADERAFITELTTQKLRLYVVTDVVAGQQITLCDALDGRKRPVTVREKSGSQTLQAGAYLGGRILNLGAHFELSGVIYMFSRFTGPEAVTILKKSRKELNGFSEELGSLMGMMLQRIWLDQFICPMPLPTLIDAYSKEPLLLITDHYRVADWRKLTKALARQTDIDGDQASGWVRFLDCEDGERRTLVDIHVDPAAHRVSLFYKTRGYATKGRAWFDALAGKSVTYLLQDISDPIGAFNANEPANRTAKPRETDDLSPEMLNEACAQAVQRIYANWANQPLPALNGKTPRQALKTPAGTERVKGLIRSYEATEKGQAAQQNRPATKFDFLWEQIGLKP